MLQCASFRVGELGKPQNQRGETFKLVEKLITNEYFLNLVSNPEEVAELRKLAENKVSLIKTMTSVELRRLAQFFILEVAVRKDEVDLIVRGDGFKKLMGKEED